MDEIQKVINKLSANERQKIKSILKRIAKNDFDDLDIKKLKGHSNIFRIRSGSLRIIFRRNNKDEVFVLAISRRSEKTYKDL